MKNYQGLSQEEVIKSREQHGKKKNGGNST